MEHPLSEPNMAKQTPTPRELYEALPQVPPDINNIIGGYIGGPFVFEVKITRRNQDIRIQNLTARGEYFIDWGGDGYKTYYTDIDHGNIHQYEYKYGGRYIIHIYGDISMVSFKGCNILKAISQWGGINLDDYSDVFSSCNNLKITARDSPNFQNAHDMSRMFESCIRLTGNFSNWDVSNITDMYGLFSRCTSFNSDISNWDVGNVTNIAYMFESCESFNAELGRWNVGKVTNMNCVFASCRVFNADLSRWDVSNVFNMSYMFLGCASFNSDLSRWNVGAVTNMVSMFARCKSFNSDLSQWNMSNVTKTAHMFHKCELFNSNVSAWDIRNIVDMRHMFHGCKSFESSLYAWDLNNPRVHCKKCLFGDHNSH